MTKYNFISVEGNIGAGKTTVARMLCKETGARLVLEEFEKNPFLPGFYEDLDKYALQTEMHFLHQRFRQMSDVFKEVARKPTQVVADYWLAKSMVFSQITLSGDNLRLFDQYAQLLMEQVPLPDLVIYLHQDVPRLQQNITGRARPMEAQIKPDYLENLSQAYKSFIKSHPGLRVVWIDASKYTAGNHMVNTNHLLEILKTDWPIGVNEFSL